MLNPQNISSKPCKALFCPLLKVVLDGAILPKNGLSFKRFLLLIFLRTSFVNILFQAF